MLSCVITLGWSPQTLIFCNVTRVQDLRAGLWKYEANQQSTELHVPADLVPPGRLTLCQTSLYTCHGRALGT